MEEETSITFEGKNLGNLRVVDLKEALEKRGLSKSGSKKDLLKRLKQQLEFEKLSGERKTAAEGGMKLDLDADTEQNEFVQQYLAQQQKIFAQQKEVKRLIEMEEVNKSSEEMESCDSTKEDDEMGEDEATAVVDLPISTNPGPSQPETGKDPKICIVTAMPRIDSTVQLPPVSPMVVEESRLKVDESSQGLIKSPRNSPEPKRKEKSAEHYKKRIVRERKKSEEADHSSEDSDNSPNKSSGLKSMKSSKRNKSVDEDCSSEDEKKVKDSRESKKRRLELELKEKFDEKRKRRERSDVSSDESMESTHSSEAKKETFERRRKKFEGKRRKSVEGDSSEDDVKSPKHSPEFRRNDKIEEKMTKKFDRVRKRSLEQDDSSRNSVKSPKSSELKQNGDKNEDNNDSSVGQNTERFEGERKLEVEDSSQGSVKSPDKTSEISEKGKSPDKTSDFSEKEKSLDKISEISEKEKSPDKTSEFREKEKSPDKTSEFSEKEKSEGRRAKSPKVDESSMNSARSPNISVELKSSKRFSRSKSNDSRSEDEDINVSCEPLKDDDKSEGELKSDDESDISKHSHSSPNKTSSSNYIHLSKGESSMKHKSKTIVDIGAASKRSQDMSDAKSSEDLKSTSPAPIPYISKPFVSRKISLSSRKTIPETDVKTKRSKWGNIAATQKKSISISTNSLKSCFPEFKLFKESAPLPEMPEPEAPASPLPREQELDFPEISKPIEDKPAEEEREEEEQPMECEIEGATHILFVRNLVRPFTLNQLKDLLKETGSIVEDQFWIDKIKSKCFVTYESEEAAAKTRNALNGKRWPPSNPKILSVEFSTEEELTMHRNGQDVPKVPPPAPIPTIEEPRRERPMREWDRDKIVQDFPPRENKENDRRRSPERKIKKESKKRPNDEAPAKLLDDLFQKTKATPCIYWLPLTDEQVKQRAEAKQLRRLEREKRNQLREQERTDTRNRRSDKPREKDRRRSSTRSRSPIARRR